MNKKTIADLIEFVNLEIKSLKRELIKLEHLDEINPVLIPYLDEQDTLESIVKQLEMIPNRFKLVLMDLEV